ncbi:unnamed protein product [Phytophthora lilii]|uniref:Unnamed protein product n=1 Tax=Phytophthora lilii TaxID=2077276 RepID=A0A9W6TY20_9STRA|nr:unnamed protein product [Phytophthora lilii]
MLGSRQRATLAYRPQANGQQERSVQTVVRAIRAYVSGPDQSDWDDQVEKLMRALNTSFDATRLDTPFYLVHGWDPPQTKAKVKRSEAQTKIWKELSERLKSGFQVSDSVWLYLGRVQPELTKKFAHLWHGPFRIIETSDDFRCKLKIEGSGYNVYPWVHVSRLKPRALFPDRPTMEVEVSDDDAFDVAYCLRMFQSRTKMMMSMRLKQFWMSAGLRALEL